MVRYNFKAFYLHRSEVNNFNYIGKFRDLSEKLFFCIFRYSTAVKQLRVDMYEYYFLVHWSDFIVGDVFNSEHIPSNKAPKLLCSKFYFGLNGMFFEKK